MVLESVGPRQSQTCHLVKQKQQVKQRGSKYRMVA